MVIGDVLIYRQNSLGYLAYYFVRDTEGNAGYNEQTSFSNHYAIKIFLFHQTVEFHSSQSLVVRAKLFYIRNTLISIYKCLLN